MDDKERYGAGMTVRRAVLGDAHVDRSLTKVNDFNGDFQNFITRYAWGEIWTDPTLDRKTRSCMVLSMMIALNRVDEFKLHVKAAFNNGLTKNDIRAVIKQAAVYCGVPAGNSATHWAEEVFAQMETDGYKF
ncbi:4-carboxymuconolactone decarboxylase [Ferrovibrio sp.]|uniref:4-carboxymuconolactone decarboxylase n=1 Tax=Ferrovibrio sp. TaxID=1917215 RepID=UPI0026173D98|nr:4-carboxymuconolactone decarboxylase [Ferrovibrio sp.]